MGESSPAVLAFAGALCDWMGNLSPVIYLAAISLAFVVLWLASGLYVLVALIWLVPDRRIERVLRENESK